MKILFFILFSSIGAVSYAQSSEELAANNELKKTEETASLPIKEKELPISLKNTSERKVSVFVGPKKEVFSGKGMAIGGLSNNVFYLFKGDVICIMADPKTTHACSIIKEGMDKVEINSSGNGFVK